MEKILAIDSRIEELKLEKKKLQLREAESLYKGLQAIMGREFSSLMIMGIVAKARNDLDSNPLLKEEWVKAYTPFPKKSKKVPKQVA